MEDRIRSSESGFEKMTLAFEKKVDMKHYIAGMEEKLDKEIFIKLYPEDKPPEQTLNEMVRTQIDLN